MARFASAVEDQDVFTSAMTAIVEIRSALLGISSEVEDMASDHDEIVGKVRILFDPTFDRLSMELLRDTLAEASHIQGSHLPIRTFRSGSTFIEMACTTTLSVGTLLASLNFVLRQATVSVKRATQLKKALKQMNTLSPPRSTRYPSLPSTVKARAVLRGGAVTHELAPVRTAVRKSGRRLLELDEKAEVAISPKGRKGGGK